MTIINVTQTTNAQHGTVLGFSATWRPVNLKGYFLYQSYSESECLSIEIILTKYFGNGDWLVVATGGNFIANTILLDSV